MLLNRGIQPALMGKVIATFPHAHALPPALAGFFALSHTFDGPLR